MTPEIERMVAEARERVRRAGIEREEAEHRELKKQETAALAAFEEAVVKALGGNVLSALGDRTIVGTKAQGFAMRFLAPVPQGGILSLRQVAPNETLVSLSLRPDIQGSQFNLSEEDARDTFLLRLGDILQTP